MKQSRIGKMGIKTLRTLPTMTAILDITFEEEWTWKYEYPEADDLGLGVWPEDAAVIIDLIPCGGGTMGYRVPLPGELIVELCTRLLAGPGYHECNLPDRPVGLVTRRRIRRHPLQEPLEPDDPGSNDAGDPPAETGSSSQAAHPTEPSR